MPVHCWKNIVTVATITLLNMAFVLNKLPIATNCNLNVFIVVSSRK